MNHPIPRVLSLLTLVLALTLALASCEPLGTSVAPPDAPQLRVVTWNAEWFPGRDPEPTREAELSQMKEARAALAELQPDVLLMQEVRDWKSAEALVSAVPGLQLHVVSDFFDRPQNLVIASRLNASSGWSELWRPESPETPPRGFSFAALELPGGRFLLAYSVHLKSNRGDQAVDRVMRQQAARQILDHASKMLAIYGRVQPCVLVVGGDFNTSLDDARFDGEKTLGLLRESGLKWAHEGVPFNQRITIPGGGPFPPGCFDHLFFAGAQRIASHVPQFPKASDHNPVILDLDLSPQSQPKLGPLPPPVAVPASTGGDPVARDNGPVNALDTTRLRELEGRDIVVYGTVTRIGQSPKGRLHFLNFDQRRGGFTALIRDANFGRLVAELGGSLEERFVGKVVEVSGTLTLHRGTPQIEITRADQLRVK